MSPLTHEVCQASLAAVPKLTKQGKNLLDKNNTQTATSTDRTAKDTPPKGSNHKDDASERIEPLEYYGGGSRKRALKKMGTQTPTTQLRAEFWIPHIFRHNPLQVIFHFQLISASYVSSFDWS
jgi:hypothetical protein